MREIVVRLHRWIGLATAAFLFVAGLTGAIIAFNHELDEWLNPELFHASSPGAPIAPLTLAARVEAAEPRLRVTYIPLEREPGHALVLGVAGRLDPKTQLPYELGYNEVFLDPVTGARLGEREWGVCCFSRKQAIPFIYSIHYTLHLPGLWGVWVMGAIALAWAVDCFAGFYLTLPARRRARAEDGVQRASFWRRWRPAWGVKFGANRARVNFDLHRAGGLWFWAVLFALAVSAVSLNLHFEVFRPMLSLVTPLTPSPFDPAEVARRTIAPEPGVPYETILSTGKAEAARRGWPEPGDVFFSPETGVYGVGFGDHHAAGLGAPYLFFDSATGRVMSEHVPGKGTAGDVVLQTMFPLHSGQIIGLPGRIAICLTGIAVAMLSVTGVVIWAKKRKGRRALAARAGRDARAARVVHETPLVVAKPAARATQRRASQTSAAGTD